MPELTLRRTRMRPPFVKRQTTSRSGFFAVFSAFFPWQGQRPGSWAHLISFYRCRGSMLHQTRIEVLPPLRWRLQRDVGPVLCDLETFRCPHTVLRNREAARLPCASSLQARGRGSTHHPWCDHRRYGEEPERVSNQPQRAQG